VEEFVLTKEEKDGYFILRPAGILDQEGAEIFRETFMDLLILERKHMIIDLRNVQFLFSFAVGVLANCHQEAAKRGKKFILCEVPQSISRILTQVSFDELLDIQTTLSAAEREI